MTTETGRGGRPPFVPTPALRRRVEKYVACGMSHKAISHVLGIDKNTVEKHFRDELSRGAALIKAKAMDMLMTSAEKGNVSAQKKVYEVAAAAVSAQEVETMSQEPMSPRRVRPGKKEQANIDARTAGAGTEWESYLKMDDDLPDLPN